MNYIYKLILLASIIAYFTMNQSYANYADYYIIKDPLGGTLVDTSDIKNTIKAGCLKREINGDCSKIVLLSTIVDYQDGEVILNKNNNEKYIRYILDRPVPNDFEDEYYREVNSVQLEEKKGRYAKVAPIIVEGYGEAAFNLTEGTIFSIPALVGYIPVGLVAGIIDLFLVSPVIAIQNLIEGVDHKNDKLMEIFNYLLSSDKRGKSLSIPHEIITGIKKAIPNYAEDYSFSRYKQENYIYTKLPY